MAYTLLTSRKVDYAVDWGVIERFCRSYWLTYYHYQSAETVTMSDSTWYNPFSWKMPDIKTINVDWDTVRSQTRTRTDATMSDYKYQASYNMPDIANDVKYKLQQTQAIKRDYKNWLKEIQAENLAAMDRADKDYTGLKDAAVFVRNTSADVILIGSTIATGGAGTALLAGSSALKGVAKYQDTGSAGAAVLYGAGSMALGAFKVGGATLTRSGEFALILAQGSLEGGTSLAAGDSFTKAVTQGGLKIAGTGAAQVLFSSSTVKIVFSKMPIPFNVFSVKTRNGADVMMEDVADKLAEKIAKKQTEIFVKKELGGASASRAAPPAAQDQSSGTDFFDEVPIDDVLLLDLSIVNMQKGIGRGW